MSGIYCKSCEHMDEVADDSVDLVVTSPPYWNAIDYEQHLADPTEWYRTRRGSPYEEYLDWLRVCFSEVFKKQKPGGFCGVVIGTVLYKGKHYPVPQHFTALMEQIGYRFHQEIVWYKVTGGVKRAGVTIQHPYPGYYCPNIMTESILIFQKPGPKIYAHRSRRDKEQNRINIDSIFTREIANNIWHIAPVPPNHLPHPCPFPEEIPYRLILFYSYKGDLVLDPFLGIGTTTKVARALGRQYLGYEIQSRYVEIALKRLHDPLHLREQLISVFEKVPVTDDVYYRTLEAHENDIGQLRLPGVEVLHEVTAGYASAETSRQDRLDYESLKERAPWLRSKQQKIVMSPDLDGIVSAMLLQSLWQSEVVGFYDAQVLYILDGFQDLERHDLVFLDHDIYRKAIPSVGHHLLQWSDGTPIPEHTDQDAKSVNPNLIRCFTFNRHFTRKYPFGSFHFLAACYSAWGDLRHYHPAREFVPVMLHIDSSLENAFSWKSNALDWLEWLGGSEESSPIYPLCRAVMSTSPRRLLQWGNALEQKIQELGFTKKSQCKTNDPTDPKQWERLLRLVNWLRDITGWELALPDFPNEKVVVIEIERGRCKPTKANFQRTIAQRPFSYALISQAGHGLNYGHLPSIGA